jgi:hypothetical protein
MYTQLQKEDQADVIHISSENLGPEVITEIQKRCQFAVDEQRSVILNMEKVQQFNPEALSWVRNFHAEMYAEYHLSFVICLANHLTELQALSNELNITPTQMEAVDMVNMEVIERELLG